MMTSPPLSLSIAGSDPSSGAGNPADLRTFDFFGVYGLLATTSLVSQIPGTVDAVLVPPKHFLESQLQLLFSHYPIASVKTGLLPNVESILTVKKFIKKRKIPLVIDPLSKASTGYPLVTKESSLALTKELFPLATLVTPNLNEALYLLNKKPQKTIQHPQQLLTIARLLSQKSPQTRAFLIKGSLLKTAPYACDLFFDTYHPKQPFFFYHHLLPLTNGGIHGTGCTLSAAITALLAQGHTLSQSVQKALAFLHHALQHPFSWQYHNHTMHALGFLPLREDSNHLEARY